MPDKIMEGDSASGCGGYSKIIVRGRWSSGCKIWSYLTDTRWAALTSVLRTYDMLQGTSIASLRIFVWTEMYFSQILHPKVMSQYTM